MDPETAQLLLVAITVVAAFFWLLGVRFLMTCAGADRDASLTGSTEVPGQPADLSARAAALLARGETFGPVKIVEKTNDHVAFERMEAGTPTQPASRWLQRGELRLSAIGHGRCQVEWSAAVTSMSWLLSLGAAIQALGLLAIVGGYWLIATFVVPAADPALRWQTFQMLQVSHFLWPVFLVGTLYRRGRRELAAQFEALANNLPYLAGR